MLQLLYHGLDQLHGRFFVIRPGRDTDSHVRLGQKRRSLCHLLCRRLAYRAVLLEGGLFHIQKPALCLVGISDDPRLIHLRGTGHVDESGGDQPPRTGLRTGHRQIVGLQQIHHRLLQRHILLRGIDIVSEPMLQLLYHGLDQLHGRFFVIRPGRDTDMYFAGLGVGGNGGIGLTVDQIPHHGLRPALPHTADLHGLRTDNPGGQPRQIRRHTLLKHGTKLSGRAGQKDHPLALRLHNDPRCRAVLIFQHNTTLRQHGLFPVVVGGFDPSFLKITANGLSAGLMHDQTLFADSGSHFLCQIILRRPKPPGKNHNVRPAKGRFKHHAQPLSVVPHHGLKITGKSKARTFFRKVGGVGVHDIAQKQLRSHTDQFYRHHSSHSPAEGGFTSPRPPAGTPVPVYFVSFITSLFFTR